MRAVRGIQKLVGTTVLEVYMNKRYIRFVTDRGSYTFEAYGDCCSSTELYDFIGVQKLLLNRVLEVHEINLDGSHFKKPMDYEDVVAYYGIKFVVEDPQWGEMTAVLAFRNNSNGYYGGSLEDAQDREVYPRVFVDVIEAEDAPR